MKAFLKSPWLFLLLFTWGLVAIVLNWLQTDEPLSKISQDFFAQVQQYDPNLKQDPYFFILGFDAKPNISPQQFGRKKYQAGWAAFYSDKSIAEIEKDNAQLMEMSTDFFTAQDQALLKKLKDNVRNNQVYQDILTNRDALQRIDRQQTLLKKRYQMYMALQPSEKPLLLNFNSIYPNYSLILSMNYLYISQLVYQNDHVALQVHIEKLKQKLSYPENLLDKMVVIVMMRQSIDLLNDLNKKDPLNAKMITALTPKQLSMQLAFTTEFMMTAIFYNRLSYKDSEIFDFQDENGQILEKSKLKQWIYPKVSPFVFKKNMTINQFAQLTQDAIEFSTLDDQAFNKRMRSSVEYEEPHFQVKNYMGQILVKTSIPQWYTYDIRVRMLNQKIHVLNNLAKNRKIDLKELNKNHDGYMYTEKNGQLCIILLDSLVSEELLKQHNSCLKI